MSPLFMDPVCEPGSPGSLSAEEGHSNTAGSEREGRLHMGPRGTKRQEKNRDAARKSRRKQTERADELHKELQSLEQSNSALHKEIAALKKDLHFYEAALKKHEPLCRLRASPSGSDASARRPVPLSAACRSSSEAPKAASRSVSASVTSSRGPKVFERVEKPRFMHAETAPASFPSASLALFSDEPPATSRATSATPGFGGPLLNTCPSSSTAAQLQSQPNPTDVCFTADAFFTEQESFASASRDVPPFLPHSEVDYYGAVMQEHPANAPQLHLFDFSGNPSSSDPLLSLLLPPAPQLLPVVPQSSLEQLPAPGFGPTTAPAPLLSQLTVPAPLDVLPPTSGSFHGPFGQHVQSQPPPGEPATELLFLEVKDFLENNGWRLGDTHDK